MSERRRDGSKLSFADLDKLRRERKHGRSNDRGRIDRAASNAAQQNYRKALEKAFDSGRLAEFAATMQRAREPVDVSRPAREPAQPESDTRVAAPSENPAPDSAAPPVIKRKAVDPAVAERRKLARKITDAGVPRDVAKAVDRYLERYGDLPRDFDILEKALGHGKSKVVLLALERLEEWVSKHKPRRTRSLAVQLSILEETHDDSDVRSLAARLRAAL